MVEKFLNSDPVIRLNGYQTFSFGKEQCVVYFKGALHVDDELADVEKWIQSLVGQLENRENRFKEYLVSELVKTSGMFSMVIRRGNDFYLTGDRIRSIAVYYGFNQDQLFLANNLDEYQKQYGPFLCDDDNVEEFIASGYAYGGRTIFKDVSTLQAGEVVTIKGNQVSAERYFEYRRNEQPGLYKDLEEFTKALDQTLLTAFSRMIEQTPNVNRWLVPLSGGHDSRIVANFLYRLGQKNV
ncbi:MAG: hypothetical protein K8R52_10680, partial [Bacteroidales bacterium]|nr:hypothetical protein [Bacteroidales bacterium]